MKHDMLENEGARVRHHDEMADGYARRPFDRHRLQLSLAFVSAEETPAMC